MKFIICSIVVAILMLPVTAAAQEDHRLDVAITAATIGYVSTSVWDAKFTYDCVKRGTCREANPLLAPIVNRHGIGAAMSAKVAFNLGVFAGINLIAHEWPERKKTTLLMLLTANAVNVAVLTHNYRVLQR